MNHTSQGLRTVTVIEWETKLVPGVQLCEEDRDLANSLSSQMKSKLKVDQLLNALRITASSWVGVVRFRGLEIQIIPKLDEGNLGLVTLIDYAGGLDALKWNPASRTFKGTGENLFDLIAMLLADSCERVVRAGILSDYCEVETDLPVIRGRLQSRKQVLKRFGRIDRLECRYDEYLTDIPENRILLAALSACAHRVRNPRVSMPIRRLLALFSEVCTLPGTDLAQIRSTIQYNRMNEHYREPHEFCWLIIDALGIEDFFAAGKHQCFAFLLDMNRLFQDFITRWLGQALRETEFKATAQRRDKTILWSPDLDRNYTSVIPDVLIERSQTPGIYLPLDAKYKLFDERRMPVSDIYQTFVYAYAYGQQHAVLPTSLVLYAASATEDRQYRLHVRQSGGATTSAQIRLVPIHIPSALAEAKSKEFGRITKRVIDLISDVFSAALPA